MFEKKIALSVCVCVRRFRLCLDTKIVKKHKSQVVKKNVEYVVT
jgi:hypothetical protein